LQKRVFDGTEHSEQTRGLLLSPLPTRIRLLRPPLSSATPADVNVLAVVAAAVPDAGDVHDRVEVTIDGVHATWAKSRKWSTSSLALATSSAAASPTVGRRASSSAPSASAASATDRRRVDDVEIGSVAVAAAGGGGGAPTCISGVADDLAAVVGLTAAAAAKLASVAGAGGTSSAKATARL
jgi:hypothetical protein